MLRKLRNRKAQSTAEYAILIGVVVAALVAMQTYVKRGLQGRMKDATDTFANETSALGTTAQYEPYYLSQTRTTQSTSQSAESTSLGGATGRDSTTSSTSTGSQTTGW